MHASVGIKHDLDKALPLTFCPPLKLALACWALILSARGSLETWCIAQGKVVFLYENQLLISNKTILTERQYYFLCITGKQKVLKNEIKVYFYKERFVD